MIPQLFNSNETTFSSTNKVADLTECISCLVTEERNGMFELECEYAPGTTASLIDIGMIILAKPQPGEATTQPFRIYKIEKDINGKLLINAAHIFYDTNRFIVRPTDIINPLPNLALGLSWLKNAHVEGIGDMSNFNLTADYESTADMNIAVPGGVWSYMHGRENSIIDVYGGEWKYDRFTATLMRNRGTESTEVIRYGKNLLDYTNELDASGEYNAVVGYANLQENDTYSTACLWSDKKVKSGTAGDKVIAVDFTDKFQEMPTFAQLNSLAQAYANEGGFPAESITIDYLQIQSEQLGLIELCDTVAVIDRDGTTFSVKCTKTVYDVLRDRWDSLEFGKPGDITNTLESIISSQATQASLPISQQGKQITTLTNAIPIIGSYRYAGLINFGSFSVDGANMATRLQAVWDDIVSTLSSIVGANYCAFDGYISFSAYGSYSAIGSCHMHGLIYCGNGNGHIEISQYLTPTQTASGGSPQHVWKNGTTFYKYKASMTAL